MVDSLYTLTADHFAHEERLMKEFHYPLADAHSGEHETMLVAFRRMIANFDNHGIDLIAAFVEHWIAGHLFSEDMQLAQFIQHHQQTLAGMTGRAAGLAGAAAALDECAAT
jgi:hemerythrin-like metal-binding protein